jgi:hypothetical protein
MTRSRSKPKPTRIDRRNSEAKAKVRQQRAARMKLWRHGIISLSCDVDRVHVEALLEEAGLLPEAVEHSYRDLEQAWRKYIAVVLRPVT